MIGECIVMENSGSRLQRPERGRHGMSVAGIEF